MKLPEVSLSLGVIRAIQADKEELKQLLEQLSDPNVARKRVDIQNMILKDENAHGDWHFQKKIFFE